MGYGPFYALNVAIEGGCSDEVIDLLLSRTSKTQFDHAFEFSLNCLGTAARVGNLRAARKLLDAGADVDYEDTGMALIMAIRSNDKSMVRLLLDAGASIDKRIGKEQDTPLEYALRSGYHDVLGVLLEHGTVTEKALRLAVDNGVYDTVKQMVNTEDIS
ncbi:ankyrin repeat-containing domain protein [Aspergillus karnatakaensis]|uniref:ankyrin repeat domain-containing protein n=1 Tax=Aspergillus karnatakaensis TaxID=1810916 RepID=UPI003CCE0B2B